MSELFHIAVRVREIGDGKVFRIYQTRKEGNRHLVNIRPIEDFPETQTVEEIRILSPIELIVSKVISFHSRKGIPKAGTDWRDLAVLILRFPELKEKVSAALQAKNIDEAVLETWSEIKSQDLRIEDEDEDLIF